ncbi:MAG TPA: Hsp70 family protein [Sporichthyaceae bacterium]|nr:Hsp70 family protein [Sporichthyaceae bacterium]
MGYRLGIDLGTTSTSAVIVHADGRAQPVLLAAPAKAMDTAVFIEASGAVHCGAEATRRGAEDPTRLVRRFLLRVGDAVPITVGPRDGAHARLHPQDITAALVAWVIARVSEQQQAPPEAIAVTHPASWAAHKIELFSRALTVRGLGEVRLISDVLAAGRVYAHVLQARAGDAFAVFDLGGSSAGAALLRVDPAGAVWPLGRPEFRTDLGGVDLDDAVLAEALDALPADVRGTVLAATADGGHAPVLDALRAAARRAKEDLSSKTEATIALQIDGEPVSVTITRLGFEARLGDRLTPAFRLIDDAVAGAGLERSDLCGVLLCGGSAAVPLVMQQLFLRFGPDLRLVREPDPATTVAAGAALTLEMDNAPVVPAARAAERPSVIEPTAGIVRARTRFNAPDALIQDRTVTKTIPHPAPSVEPSTPAHPVPAARNSRPTPKTPPPVEPAGPAPTPAPEPVQAAAALPAQLPSIDEDRPATVGALARISKYEKDVRIGTGRPIFHRDTEIRRELLSVIPAATELGAPMARAVVSPRRVGSIEDLLAVVPAQRRATVAYPEEPAATVIVEADLNEEGEEVVYEFVDDQTSPEDYAEPDLRPLWRKGLSRLTPARVVTLSAITVALFIGAGAWNAAVPAITGHFGGHSSTPAVTEQLPQPPASQQSSDAKPTKSKKAKAKKASAKTAG